MVVPDSTLVRQPLSEAEVVEIVRREIVTVLKSIRARVNRGQDADTVLTRTIRQYDPEEESDG